MTAKKTTVAKTIVARAEVPFRDFPAIKAKVAEFEAQGYTTKTRRVGYGPTLTILAYGEREVETQTRGTCQLCGGDFSVETGRVSLHGYKRPRWGYIIGRCAGHNELPAEQDVTLTNAAIADLTERAIPAAEAKAAELQAAYDALQGVERFNKTGVEAARAASQARYTVRALTDYVGHLKTNVLPRHGQPLYEVAAK